LASTTEIEATANSLVVPSLLSERLSAWSKFNTQVPTSVSLANFVYELKDFEHLIPNLKGVKSGKLRPSKNPTVSKDFPGSVKRVASVANSTFLNYNFAWAPFVGDLQKLSNIVQTVVNRLNYLRRTRGTETRVHYYHPDFVEFNNDGTRHWIRQCGTGGAVGDHWLTIESYKANFAASCTMLQNLEGLDDAWAVVKTTLASLGFNNPLKVVWNAIPFSFMLDWVIPIGKMLDKLQIPSFAGQWDIYDVTSSVKTVAHLKECIQFTAGGCGFQYANPVQQVRSIDVTTYNRVLGLPLSLGDVNFTSLTSHQQRLFLSLVAGNTLFKR
jgi:hypothetical protein